MQEDAVQNGSIVVWFADTQPAIPIAAATWMAIDPQFDRAAAERGVKGGAEQAQCVVEQRELGMLPRTRVTFRIVLDEPVP
jgi:hypothetical protein